MAEKPDILGFPPRDEPDLIGLLRWWRTHRGDLEGESEPGRSRGVIAYIGKPDFAIPAGPIPAPVDPETDDDLRTISVWIGPAWDGVSADTGRDILADYAVQDFTAGTWVRVIRVGAKWYVEPLDETGGGECHGPAYMLAVHGNPASGTITVTKAGGTGTGGAVAIDLEDDAAAITSAVSAWGAGAPLVYGGPLRDASVNFVFNEQGNPTLSASVSGTFDGGVVPGAMIYRVVEYPA